jgi:nitrite reductase/ring-hydroxylating ferredoxin subunit
VIKKFIVSGILFLLILAAFACSSSSSSIQDSVQTPEQIKPAATPSPAPITIPVPQEKPVTQTTPIPKPSGLIKAKWIDAQVSGTAVSIPLKEVENNWNTHFKIQIQGVTENFMAYNLDGTIYVRANVCPPCKSVGFSLDKDILVCDRCATTFKAGTGAGIKGACVNYPKASVQFKIVDGNIVLNEADLVRAYQETIKPG